MKHKQLMYQHTRELSNQIFNVFTKFRNLNVLCQVTGGTSVNMLDGRYQKNPQIVIGLLEEFLI